MVKYSIEQGGKLAEQEAEDGKPVVAIVDDAISQRVIDRSTLIDVQNRMFRDSILVRFEDGKLNPKATFTALAAFLGRAAARRRHRRRRRAHTVVHRVTLCLPCHACPVHDCLFFGRD